MDSLVHSWIEPLSLGVDVVVPEVTPVAIFHDRTLCQDSLSTGDGPAHAAVLHPVFDQRAAGAFDHACRDLSACNTQAGRIAFFEVDVVVHHMLVVDKVASEVKDRDRRA